MKLSSARPLAGRLVWLAALGAVIAAAAWLAHSLSGTPLVGYDDANVFFVYARNLLDGHGFVFNAGGERVEGFTSLSWLLICGAAMAITSRFEVLLFAINVVVVAVALWRLHGFVADVLAGFGVAGRDRGAIVAFTFIAAVALTPGFVIWSVVSLMDAGLWSGVFVLTAVAALRSRFDPDDTRASRLLPLLLIVLVLTRPESLLLGPAMIAIASGWAAAAAFGLAAAGLIIWRLAYFGYPLPNTYYATAGESIVERLHAGFDYFSDFAVANPVVPVALAAGVITTSVSYKRYRAAANPTARSLFGAQAGLLALMAAGCAIPILEGGDRFGFWRMFQPVVLLTAIQGALTAVAVATTPAPRARARATMVCIVTILLALVPWRHWLVLNELEYPAPVMAKGIWYTPQVEISIADDMRRIGGAFARTFPDRKPTVGVIVAGGFAFAYDGPTIDLMGHNHVAMAHAPGPRSGARGEMAFSHAVFNALAPDVILLSRWSPERDWFALPMMSGDYDRPAHLIQDYFPKRAASMRIFDYGVMKGLLFRSEAGKRYAWASVRPTGGARWMHAVFNREYLKRLEERGYEVVFATPPKT